MVGWRVGVASLLLGVLGACGGKLDGDSEVGAGSVAGESGQAGSRSSGGNSGKGGSPGKASGGSSNAGATDAGLPPLSGCPDAGPPPARVECDPLQSSASCPLGLGCYPFVEHPFGTGCGTQTFGTRCVQAGTGRQGAVCGDGTDGCAPGHVCVIGAQAGRRCVALCLFDGANTCPAGMICGETDIDGFGVCS